MKKTIAIVTALVLLAAGPALARKYKRIHKNAIVVAMFGTTHETALKALLNIRQRMQARFPETPVRIAFTSNIIRKVWRKRAADPAYAKAHPGVPEDIIHVRGPLAAMAELQDAGYDTIVVQPTHLAPGEEFLDLGNYVRALAGIETIKAKYKPFNKVVLGRPALGTFGPRHPYIDDIRTVVRALAADAARARGMGAALLYMGHGNEFFPSGGSYLEFEAMMNRTYPDTRTIVGCVEGFPSRDDAIAKLEKTGIRKVLLKPLMVVAGDHATNDMAGPQADSWLSVLEAKGFRVVPVKKGLGENDAFADIFVAHAADAARDAGIELR
jgi:sirohydrochlorin cobaltochelatase